MKYFLLLPALLILADSALAIPAVTRKNAAACYTKEHAEDLNNFAISQDRDSFNAYILTEKCILTQEGHKVTVTESPGMFGNITGFVYKGVKLWGGRKVVEYTLDNDK